MNGNLHRLILSFGGNQKETLSCFEQAKVLLKNELGDITSISSIYKSEPWGFKVETSDFLNQVLEINTSISPEACLSITQTIEKKLGRTSKSKQKVYSDRPIDIDLLFYDELILDLPHLTLPHYLIHERKFILQPLVEIIPEFIHPVIKKSMKELLLLCSDNSEVKPLSI